MMDEEAELSLLVCSLCDFRCYDNRALLKHARSVHENDPNFVIYCSQCGRSYKKWTSLKKHLHREHPGIELCNNRNQQ